MHTRILVRGRHVVFGPSVLFLEIVPQLKILPDDRMERLRGLRDCDVPWWNSRLNWPLCAVSSRLGWIRTLFCSYWGVDISLQTTNLNTPVVHFFVVV